MRNALKIVAAGAALAASVLLLAFSIDRPAASRPPNILLIIADDMTWQDSQVYGNPDVPTPNLARLAREGMVFERAFQSTALCSVTRHQLYTGLDPIRNGAYPQHSWSRPGVKTVFGYLKDLGYRVGITGKTHVGPPANFPWEYLGDPAGAHSGEESNLPPIDFRSLEAFIARDRRQPFFAVVASHNPHSPWSNGDASKFDPAKLRVPAYLADTPGTREGLRRYYAEVTALDEEVGKVLAILDRQGVAGETLVMFTSEQGSSVPFAKWTLYEAGVRTELIVRWPGRVKAGARTGALVSYADVTPTFIEAAGGRPPSDLDGRSLIPVLTGRSDRHRDYIFGIHTNLGVIGGEPYPIRSVRDDRYRLIRNLAADKPYRNVLNNSREGSRMIRDWEAAASAGNAWAAARVAAYGRRPAVELYDLVTDPNELKNRADDPALASVRRRLEAELDRWMVQQGDTGMAKELEALRYLDPAIVRSLEQRYPDAAPHAKGSEAHR